MFYNMRLKVMRKDIALDAGLSNELQHRLPGAEPPQAFVNGQHLGVRCAASRVGSDAHTMSGIGSFYSPPSTVPRIFHRPCRTTKRFLG